MQLVAINKIKEAQARYPAAQKILNGWFQIINKGSFLSEKALRATFGDMRGYNYQYKFPVPGTTLLVHTLINFESQVAFIDDIKPGSH